MSALVSLVVFEGGYYLHDLLQHFRSCHQAGSNDFTPKNISSSSGEDGFDILICDSHRIFGPLSTISYSDIRSKCMEKRGIKDTNDCLCRNGLDSK